MIDYRKMPLGPLAPGHVSEIVECPHCHEHGLKQEDFKDPISGSKEKETVYIHLDGTVMKRFEKNGRMVEEVETVTQACPIKG